MRSALWKKGTELSSGLIEAPRKTSCKCQRRSFNQSAVRASTPLPTSRRIPREQFGDSTSSLYHPPASSSGANESIGASEEAGPPRTRSFILDLPRKDVNQQRPESLKARREKVYHEQVKAEMSTEEKIVKARWYADPWYQMRKSPHRRCVVTRQLLPNAFMVCFKPAKHHKDKDVYEPQDTEKTTLGKAKGRKATAQASSDTLERDKIVLVPDRVLHPRYIVQRGSSSGWATLRRDVIEQLSSPGPQMHFLSRLARNLVVPESLPDMVEAQLQERVIQELGLLGERIRSATHKPETRLRGKSRPEGSTIGVPQDQVVAGDSKGHRSDSGGHQAFSESESPENWMDNLGEGKSHLKRLTEEETLAVSRGKGYRDEGTVALLDMKGLTEATTEQSSDDSLSQLSQDLITFMPGPDGKGDIPIFHLRNLLPPSLHEAMSDRLGNILAWEYMESVRAQTAKELQNAHLGEGEPADTNGAEPEGSEGAALGEQANDAKSDLLVLSVWPAPYGGTGRTGDLAVPLFRALYRLYLWHGHGWKEFEVNQKGFRV